MRKRRRTRYKWLPVLPDALDNGAGGIFYTATRQINVLTAGLTPGLIILPVTTDRILEDEASQNMLMVEMVGSDYFLKRIVGKLSLAYAQDNRAYVAGAPPIWPAVQVGAGFFVARSEGGDQSIGSPAPIGAATATAVQNYENYSPLSEGAIREPWIWRRTWSLGNNYDAAAFAAGANTSGQAYYPANNLNFGSVLDGPHIDAKTARRVGQDNRLWFALAIQGIPTSSAIEPTQGCTVSGTLDIRLLGALRKSKSSGAF